MISITRRLLLGASVTAFVLLMGVSGAYATVPAKLIVESQFGAKVNATTGGNFCTFASGNTCQPGEISSISGGFDKSSPAHVAVNTDPSSPSYGNVYAIDLLQFRIQEFTPAGKFVLMFGWEVNETTHGNVCTQEEVETEGVKCKSGVPAREIGGQPGALGVTDGLTVDPVSGDVYVAEGISGVAEPPERVQKFTAAGQFVSEIGREVNETAHKNGETANENLCPVKVGDKCKEPIPASDTGEHGAFKLFNENNLAAGGPEDRLYVGEEHGVQEFTSAGAWVHELSLTSIPNVGVSVPYVNGIAVDQASGELYILYQITARRESQNVIYKFDTTDKQIGEFVFSPREAQYQYSVQIESIALDSSGRLAVMEAETSFEARHLPRYAGLLLNAATGRRISEFTLLQTVGETGYREPDDFDELSDLAFSAGDVGSGEEMYGASRPRNEIVGYIPRYIAELVTGPVTCTEEAAEHETSVGFECELTDQVNPEGVADTETQFLWGNEKALSGRETQATALQRIATGNTLVQAPAATIKGLRPNETLYSEPAGYDEVNEAPESPLSGEESATVIPMVAPRPLGEPSVLFVKSSSVVIFGELNPENARTEYSFEYGTPEALANCPGGLRAEACAGVQSTPLQSADEYGKLGTTAEVRSLQPGSEYACRMFAESENTAKSEKRTATGQVGYFTTAPIPLPQASTGTASAVGSGSATISGTVNPDGQPASYAFELGVYQGPATQYGVVFSGSAGAGVTPVSESLQLSGLQPGTTYAYRIAVSSGYIENEAHTLRGATATFTTGGLPAVLALPSVLEQLPIPSMVFPVQAKTKTKTVKKAKRTKKTKKSKKPKGKAKKANRSRPRSDARAPRHKK